MVDQNENPAAMVVPVPSPNGVAVSPRIQSPELVSARHARIVEAATPLFVQHGFHNTSVRMIAEAAGLSMGNLYQYIRKKEDVLCLTALHIMSDFNAVTSRFADEPSIKRQIAGRLGGLIDVIDRNRQGLKLLYRESASLGPDMRMHIQDAEDDVRKTFSRLIEDGIAAGEIRPCNAEILSVNLLLLAHAWAIKGWTLKHFTDFATYRAEQITNALRMIPFVD